MYGYLRQCRHFNDWCIVALISRRAVIASGAAAAIFRPAKGDAAFHGSNGAGSSAQWKGSVIGPGGFVTSGAASNDGTLVVRTDTFGQGYIANLRLAQKWKIAMPGGALPSAFRAPNSHTVAQYIKPMGMWDIGIAPSNSQWIYAITAGYVFVSSDGGVTWAQTSCPIDTTEYSNQNGGGYPYVAIDPQNPLICLVGRSSIGLYMTSNGGSTWAHITAVPTSGTISGVNRGRICVCFDRSSSVVSGATQGIYAGSWGNGVYHSTDGGATWASTSCPTTWIFGMDCSTDGYVYLVPSDSQNNLSGHTLYIYNGTSWSSVTTGSEGNAMGSAASDPNTTGRLVTLCVDGAYNVSLNHGSTWSEYRGPGSSSITATDVPWIAKTSNTFLDVSRCFFDPSQSNTLIIPMGVGVVYLNPSNTPASPAFTDFGAGIEQLVALDISAPPAGGMVGASWDRPLLTSVGNPPFTSFPSNYYPSPTLEKGYQVDYASDASGVMLAWIDTTGGVVSLNNGSTWAPLTTQPYTGTAGGTPACSTSTNWIVFRPGGTVFYTTDGGSTWGTAAGLPATGWVQGSWISYCTILCADRVTAGTFYAYNNSSGTYISTDSGANWTLQSFSHPSSGTYFERIRSVPGNVGHLFLCAGQSTASFGLFKSTDGGVTWSQPNSNITLAWAFDFGAVKSGGTYPAIYLSGTISGVWGTYRSNDAGVTWTLLQDATYGEWPNGNVDNVNCLGADKNNYGYVYIGFNGSGYWYGYFP
jgi:hypothetical protein